MGHRVLVVDDEPDFLSTIRIRLSQAGYDVICAQDGRDALAKMKLKFPDVIVSDVMMPVMDGIDFFQELKSNPDTKSIPLIMMTVQNHLEDGLRAVGADGFLAKPVEADELIRTIQRCLERSVREE